MIKTCPKCKQKFECKNNEQCWCMEYEYDKENLENLRNLYSDCLCPQCLKHYMDNCKKETLSD
jgi:hypothetical protein